MHKIGLSKKCQKRFMSTILETNVRNGQYMLTIIENNYMCIANLYSSHLNNKNEKSKMFAKIEICTVYLIVRKCMQWLRSLTADLISGLNKIKNVYLGMFVISNT